MAKDKKDRQVKPNITTKKKMDNTIEVQINSTPDETVFGRILVWTVCVCTFLGIVLSLIFVILAACGVF